MTLAEAENFYRQDKKKYELSKNKELLEWLQNAIKNGYNPYVTINDLQELINNITTWYELKYPERELEFYEGIKYYDFGKVNKLSNQMTIEQLLYRLPKKQLSLINCEYRAKGAVIRNLYDKKGNIIEAKPILFMRIKNKNNEPISFSRNNQIPNFLLYADTYSGIIDTNYSSNYYLKKYIDSSEITLDELLIYFNKHVEELEYNELEECICNHNFDIELRKQILQLVALKLLYSNQTIPEHGYIRAQRFINEFNKKLDLNLSTDEIQTIISTDYTKEKFLIDNDNIIPNPNIEQKNNILQKVKQLVVRKIC